MDYKLTALVKQIKCEKTEIADFPSMKFGNLANGQSVFDATRYYEENELEPIDYKIFSRVCKCFINALITRLELDAGELFFLNTDGHILIHKELAITFLQFSNPDIYAYFNSMIWDLLDNGVAISDGLIATLAATRVPNEVLQEIIDTRNANETS
jgi:hypothetical protein